MASLVIALVLAAVSVKKGRASPTDNNPACVDLEIPISVNQTAAKWLQPEVDSTYDAVDWIRYQTTRTTPKPNESYLGPIAINETFSINAKLCIPSHGPKSKILQIATHGAGFDKRYWDVTIKPAEYSYLYAALTQAQRLHTTQLPIHIEILRQLTLLSSSGSLLQHSKPSPPSHPRKPNPQPPNSLPASYIPSKIIHIGHSLGSIISVSLVTSYPNLSSGLIATGFLPTKTSADFPPTLNINTWGFEFAKENDSVKFARHGSGYIVQATKGNVELSFFGEKESSEPELLQHAWEIRQPVGVGEFTSLLGAMAGGGPMKEGTGPGAFKGAVQFVIGEKDYGGCGGDCKGIYDLEELKATWKAAKGLGVHLQGGGGGGGTWVDVCEGCQGGVCGDV
ncbi:hypothetical protein B0T14DRAFT_584450, partial [Immersiella caudata]